VFPVANFLKYVVTEVVRYSIFNCCISQGSAATHLRNGGIFSDILLQILY